MHDVPHHRAEIRKDSLQQTSFLLLLILGSCADSIKVTVPAKDSAAARGYSVVLGCEFSPDLGQNPDLSSLVVTWQRQEDNRVVHSFYYEQDQLDKQASAYRDRTALFVNELSKGNASLKLDRVGVNDAGRYLCTVSTQQGTDKAELRLAYGALYTEPRLTIKPSFSDILVQYETEGYPEPEVKWKGERGETLSNDVQTSVKFNNETGLYYIQSCYTLPEAPLNVTFFLENQLLAQYMQRPISYPGGQNSFLAVVVVLLVVSVLFVVTAVALVWMYFRGKKKN